MQRLPPGAIAGAYLEIKEAERKMNMRKLMYKLQTALCLRGDKVKINQFQTWSEQGQRMVTKYVLTATRKVGETEKTVTLLQTYKASEVVQKLAELYGGDSA